MVEIGAGGTVTAGQPAPGAVYAGMVEIGAGAGDDRRVMIAGDDGAPGVTVGGSVGVPPPVPGPGVCGAGVVGYVGSGAPGVTGEGRVVVPPPGLGAGTPGPWGLPCGEL